MTRRDLASWRQEVREELLGNILPWWLRHRDHRGGWPGTMTNDGSGDSSPRGIVMHARFLWTYATAYRILGGEAYADGARHALAFMETWLWDAENQGYHWMVESDGHDGWRPQEGPRVIYGQAFAIYGLAAWARASGDGDAARKALDLFQRLEAHARDPVHGGYREAVSLDWSRPVPNSLSSLDQVCDKSMNTNLHVMEAYTALWQATGEPRVAQALEDLLVIHRDRIRVEPEHFGLYFLDDWQGSHDIRSFGHDIEGSWLMTEAAQALGKPSLAGDAPTTMAAKTLRILRDYGPGLINEEHHGDLDATLIWWVQAEGMVGMVNAYQLTGDSAYLQAAQDLWRNTMVYLRDPVHGEWFWGRTPYGRIMAQPKGGVWKTSYHNSRACFELMERLQHLETLEGEEPVNPSPAFIHRQKAVEAHYETLIRRPNEAVLPDNGIFVRQRHPILSADHVPPHWRYDYNPATNPWFMERLGINAVFNAGAIKHEGQYCLVCRVEGWDRKSFFAVARSPDGINGFVFDPEPILLDETANPDINVYDMRLTKHQDGWIYGIFCSERKDPAAPASDTSSAVAAAGIVRTRDLVTWERLPDLKTRSPQQRNVVLHPDFVQGQYLLYTRPQDGFISTGSGGGICWGLSATMDPAVVDKEILLDPREYHTIKEVKNGAGAPPIKTPQGWLHIAHGVRNTAAGLRYVIYAFMTALDEPGRVIARPGGYLIAPEGEERVGDVSNVVFTNGLIVDDDGRLLIYYASSDTRMHVAVSSVDRMTDYCLGTPPDRLRSRASVEDRVALIRANASLA